MIEAPPLALCASSMAIETPPLRAIVTVADVTETLKLSVEEEPFRTNVSPTRSFPKRMWMLASVDAPTDETVTVSAPPSA